MSLQYSITRKLMRNAKFYNEQILPFFQATPRFAVQAYCLRDDKDLIDAVTSSSSSSSSCNNNEEKKFLTLQEIIRKQHIINKNSNNNNNIPFAMNALRLLSTWKQRMNATSHATMNLPSNKYKFEVGDIVQHSELNHLGVVAAKMPICFETEDWINENLGSVHDYRLSHPWYLILVARHDPLPFDFVRYGSELTHVKGPREAIGCHRMLPMFFSGFCKKSGRYVAREASIKEQVQKTLIARSSRTTSNLLLKKQQQQQNRQLSSVVENNNSKSSTPTTVSSTTTSKKISVSGAPSRRSSSSKTATTTSTSQQQKSTTSASKQQHLPKSSSKKASSSANNNKSNSNRIKI